MLVAGAAVLGAACSTSTVRVAPLPPSTAVTPAPAVTVNVGDAGGAEEPAPAVSATTTPSAAAGVGDAGPSSTTVVDPPTTEPDLTWTLLAGGDVLMDRSEAAGIDPFAGIEPSLDSADIAIINVEMTISERGEPANKEFVFRAPPSAAARIAAAGVDIANLANNHTKDYGADALVDTIDLLEAEGVIALGAGATSPDAYRHRVIEVRPGVRVAFVGASMVVPLGFPAGESRPGIASAYQRDRVLANVRVAAREADVVIAVVHWGIERMTCPDGRQRDFAFELLRNGADAVIGQHPHVLQPVVFDDGKLVAYSLGNFVWHYRSGITGETGVLQIDFDGTEIVGWSFHPHLLDSNGAPVPAAEGARVDRLTDIVGGDCARHQPPPITTPPAPRKDAEPDTEVEPETEPETEAKPEAEAESDTEPEAEAEAESGSGTEPESSDG